MILHLLRMRRNDNRNVFNDRKNVSATPVKDRVSRLNQNPRVRPVITPVKIVALFAISPTRRVVTERCQLSITHRCQIEY